MSDQEIIQWDKRLADQVRRGWDNYKHLHIDLGVARLDQSYLIAGEYLYVEQSSSADAIAEIKLNRVNNDALDLEKGVSIETVFIEVFITNDVLEDEWIDLVFGINFKYKKKIANGVKGGGLPKTGQIISYQNFDDGHYQYGLEHDYELRNVGGDLVVIDNATGLMWAADGNAAGCNNGNLITFLGALNYCNGLTFAGFSDWYLPNIKELLSIIEFDAGLIGGALLKEPPFSNTKLSIYQTSTSVMHATTYRYCLKMDFFTAQEVIKTNEVYMRACREM